jgi:hypothetical protein
MSRKTDSEALLDTLTEIDGGIFITEAGAALTKLVKTCMERGSKGGMSITIGLKPNSRGQIEVIAGFETKLPKPEKFTSILFGTEQGLLQRRDPRQPELPGLADEPAPAPADSEPPAAPREARGPRLSVVRSAGA